MTKQYTTFFEAISDSVKQLIYNGNPLRAATWQGQQQAVQFEMQELLFLELEVPCAYTQELLVMDCQPDLPWAENHFQERVAGIPTNPGITYMDWPYYAQDEKWRDGELFDITYQERIWAEQVKGVRFKAGNLGDLIDLLKEDPMTRQAYLPLFFPEDTGNVRRGRTMCSLGYHFIVRDGSLHMQYYMRSLDAVRHFRNDLYMAGRMMQWVANQLEDVDPGLLRLSATSFHCFESDLYYLKKKYTNPA